MKKGIIRVITLISALTLLLSFPVMSVAAISGDADLNGKLSASDARLALRFSVGLESFTEEQMNIADMDNDGRVDASDARKILRRSVGLDIAVITVIHGDDAQFGYADLEAVYADESISAEPVIVSTDVTVTEAKAVSIRTDELTKECFVTELFNLDEFTPDDTFVLYVSFAEKNFCYGIAYMDVDGIEKIYGIYRDKNDSAVRLEKITRNAYISASFAEDAGFDYSQCDTIYSKIYGGDIPVIISTDTKISDLQVVALQKISDEPYKFSSELIGYYGEFLPAQNLVIYVDFSNPAYFYGITYTDTDGKQKTMEFQQSDEDGSLIFKKIYNEADIDLKFVKDVYADYTKWDTVYAFNSKEKVPVVFTSDVTVKDVKILKYSWEFYSENQSPGLTLSRTVVADYGELSANKPLVIYIHFADTYPLYGISYVDADGQEKYIGFMKNKEDGSLYADRNFNLFN